MESQVRNRHPQDGTHKGEEEDHQEKSVLTKVKDKAKKIRNKLTMHGRPDEEDGEEEEEVQDATTIGSRPTGQGDNLKAPLAEFGDTKTAAKHDQDPKVQHSEKTDPIKDRVPVYDEVLKPGPNNHASTKESLVGHDQIPSPKPKVDFGKTSAMGEAPRAPQTTPLPSLGEHKSQGTDQSQNLLSGNEGQLGQSRVRTPVSSLGGDNQKTNVAGPRQTSVTGKEGQSGQTGVPRGLDDRTPISSRGDYQKTNVTDPSRTSATGKEGHFGQSKIDLDRPRGLEEKTQAFTPPNDRTKVTNPTDAGGEEIGITPIVHSFDKMNIRAGETKPSNQGSSYTEKVSSATSAVADTAISAKNAAALKLGYGGENNDQHELVKPQASSYQTTGTGQNLSTPENPSNQGSYGGKISSATYAVADTAISAKNVVASKLGYGGDADQQKLGDHAAVRPGAAAPEQQGKGITAAAIENPSNQGSYGGKISSATYAVADTAISAKNVVASKLGYGGDADQQKLGDHAAVRPGAAAPEQQGKGITAAATEKLKPAYDKVAGAGSTPMSKLPVSTGTAGKEEVHQGTATTRGEYDKAGKDRAKAQQPPSGARPVGKVTESAEVTQRLGPDSGAEDVEQSSYGKVVADTIKGAVGSLFGKADQTPASPESRGSSTGKEGL